MRLLLLIIAAYVVAVLETTLGDRIVIAQVVPDGLALIALLAVLTGDARRDFLLAGVIGTLADCLSPGRLGVGMLCFLLAGYAAMQLRGRPARWRAVQVLVIGLGTMAITLAVGGVNLMLGETAIPWWSLVARSIGVGFYTGLAAVPCVMVVRWLDETRGEDWDARFSLGKSTS
jgi:rod shape-determining protein MreD